MGELVHRVLERLYTNLKFQKMPLLKELIAFYNDLWEKEWNDAIIIVRKNYEAANYRKMGEKFIADYYNRYKPFDQTRIVALESKRLIEISPGIMFHIRIDRLSLADSSVYEIHDYKTSSSLPTKQDIDKDKQLAIYAYGVKQMYPDASKIRLVWHYLAFDKEIRVERSDEELEKVKQDALEVIDEIRACKEFPFLREGEILSIQ